ncbi:MAG TPA: hypothetical protein VFU21_10305 [Kofleriaceae bacterium]|nr:hypothetical protein [Kofleriaceae bacterium]
MTARRLSTGLLAAAVLLAGGVARADEPRVLVLPFSGSVPNAPDGTTRLTQVVARAAGLTGAEVVMGQATFADAAALAGCSEETPDCFKLLADSLRVDEVVIGDVTPTADGGSVTITLKHFQQGSVDEKSLTVSAGSIDEMVKRVAREVPRLMVPGGDTSEPPPDRIPTTAPEREPVDARPAPVDRDDDRPGRVGAMPWFLMGTGVALAAAGGGFLYAARKKQDDVDGAPIHDADDFERLVDLEDKGERYQRIGQGLLIGGGVLVAGGVVWALVRRASGSGEASEPTMALDAAPLEGGAGFVLSGAW